MPTVRALNCPNCGGSVELRGYAQTVNAVCGHCLSVLDTKSPSLQVLQEAQSREKVQPQIPLGTRGRLGGIEYEVIGFQVRSITVEETQYFWREYLLFNPYRGYRYLTEYEGHWNDIRTLSALPDRTQSMGRPAVRLQGTQYKHFQRAHATTRFVLGEFPWQVRVGETVEVNDFVAPPRMLSSEATGGEIVWSLGEYTAPSEIWKAFSLPGSAPSARGVFANQPSPYKGSVFGMWSTFLLLTMGLVAVAIVLAVLSQGNRVFQQSYSYTAGAGQQAAFVTPTFQLDGRPQNVEVKVGTNLDNDGAYFAMALINEADGHVYDFGKELGYWYGRDSDGNWTEGSREGSVTVREVPSGRYYLRVEPNMDDPNASPFRLRSMYYTLEVYRGGFTAWPFAVAMGLLLIPPLIATFRRLSFEHKRWLESDYSTAGGD